MPNLNARSTLPEKMDDTTVPDGEVRKALAEIETINRWLGGYKVMLHALESLHWPRDVVKIMDMGSGGGDMLRAIARWAQKRNRRVKLIGVDINSAMTRYASNKSNRFDNILFRTSSVFEDVLLLEEPHIVTCSLFAHHFDGDDLIALVTRMKALATHAVIINDLHRHPLAYHSIKMLTRAFSRTYLVKWDAPLSVARSLTRQEWIQVMSNAGISNYTIRWRWAWRWEIIIRNKS